MMQPALEQNFNSNLSFQTLFKLKSETYKVCIE